MTGGLFFPLDFRFCHLSALCFHSVLKGQILFFFLRLRREGSGISSGTGGASSLAPVQVLPFAITAARPAAAAEAAAALRHPLFLPPSSFLPFGCNKRALSRTDKPYWRFPEELRHDQRMAEDSLNLVPFWAPLLLILPKQIAALQAGEEKFLPSFLRNVGISSTIMHV